MWLKSGDATRPDACCNLTPTHSGSKLRNITVILCAFLCSQMYLYILPYDMHHDVELLHARKGDVD